MLPVRTRIFFRHCRWALLLMAAWFAFGTLAFRGVDGLPFPAALTSALYLGRQRSWFWDLYSFWGQCVLFGIVVSVFLLQSAQQYNPQEGCRMVAREMRDHVIVVGHTHLGARIVEDLRERKRPYVVIEKDATAVDHLVRAGEPVIVDNAREATTLEEAGVRHAKVVIVTSDNVETALLVTKRARERNPDAQIIVRCFQDDFVEILESLGASQVISTSKSALLEIEERLRSA